MKFQVYITIDLISGPECDEETVLDAICASLGRENGSRAPYRFPAYRDSDSEHSTYEVKLVDDRA